MSTDEYVPSECEVRADFVQTHTRNFDSYLTGRSLTSEQEHYGAQFDAVIARVRRDAAREALDGLAADLMEAARDCALGGDHRGAVAWRNASAHTHHRRDTHYPEETP